DVGARVFGAPAAVAPEVADSVDHAGRPERNPDDLRHQHDNAGYESEEHDVDDAHQRKAQHWKARIEIALDPVVRCAVTVAFHRLPVVGFLDIKKHARPEHTVDPED